MGAKDEHENDATHGSESPDLPAPTSERVARPLTKLPEEEQAEAWEEALAEVLQRIVSQRQRAQESGAPGLRTGPEP